MILKSPAAKAVLLSLIFAACRRTPDRACIPGVTQACLCGVGRAGVQICEALGTSFGACDCPSPIAASPALPPEVLRARAAEASSMVDRIYRAEISYFNMSSERTTASFFAAPPTPVSTPTASPYPANAALWLESPQWRAGEFYIATEHYYQYQVVPGPTGITSSFVVMAHGDLDGDGILSTYRRAAVLNAGEIQGARQESINGLE